MVTSPMTTSKQEPFSAVPPPCSPEYSEHHDPSKDSTGEFSATPGQGARHVSASAANVCQQDELRGAKHRCQFTYSDGRRCGNERAPLCLHHGSQQREPRTKSASDSPVEIPELAAICGDLTTATNINRALAKIFLLMAQGRISQKQAVAFGYIAQLLLQTVPLIRSEFVSAYGLFPWKDRLKASFECDDNWDDGDSPGRSGENVRQSGDGVVEPKKGLSITPFFRYEKVIPSAQPERAISPILPAPVTTPAPPRPLNEARLSEQSSRESVTPADYPKVVLRGVELLAGKYDVAPQGHREASPLKPVGSRPPKAHRGEVVTLVPAIRNEGRTPSPSASPATTRSERPAPPPPSSAVASSTEGPALAVPSSQTTSPPNCEAPTPPSRDADGWFSSPEYLRTRDRLYGRGHTTQWFAPAAWSGRPQPDPCPSRYQELKRQFRSMSNSAFRRLQHQNARGFWSRNLKNVTT